MEDNNLFDYDGFKKKIKNHIGEIVFITYYNDAREEIVTEKAVISTFTLHHLVAVTIFNNSFFSNGIPMQKIELIVSYPADEIIYDVNTKNNGRRKK